jgi:hypothetical protein
MVKKEKDKWTEEEKRQHSRMYVYFCIKLIQLYCGFKHNREKARQREMNWRKKDNIVAYIYVYMYVYIFMYKINTIMD